MEERWKYLCKLSLFVLSFNNLIFRFLTQIISMWQCLTVYGTQLSGLKSTVCPQKDSMKSTYYVRVQLHGLRHYSRPQLRALAYCTVGCSDLPLFWDFRKWTPCCRSGIFLWVPFQRIAQARQIFHFQKVTGTLKMIFFHEICTKEHSPEKIKVFYFRPPKMSKMDKGKKMSFT